MVNELQFKQIKRTFLNQWFESQGQLRNEEVNSKKHHQSKERGITVIVLPGTGMVLGLRVVRGPDWSHGDTDGGEGHLGTVVEIKNNMAVVLWDIGNTTHCKIGKDGKHDLRVFDNASVGMIFYILYLCQLLQLVKRLESCKPV